MKKVCIITVYNSENCGSYWQAFALREHFLHSGYEVYFLRRQTKGTSHSVYSLTKRCLRSLKQLDVVSIIDAVKQFCVFERHAANFATVNECSDNFDLCVLGSDTIWNLESAYFRDNRYIYWGGASKAKKTISYAASVANTPKNLISQFPELKKFIERLDSVSVRDLYTEQAVRELTQKEIQLVCDPTLLFDKSFYQKHIPWKCKKEERKKIFVYYFGKMPEKLEAKVRVFAQENNCDIVSMGGSIKGNVRNLAYDPYVFLECFENADFVITNTFHGTIFTLLFEKPAVFNSDGKSKVRELLHTCRLEASDCFENLDCLDDFFVKKDIDYEAIRKIINALRDNSKQYLERM